MKFKKPKSKDLMTVGTGLLAFEGGKRVGRGVVGAIPAKDAAQTQLIKGGVAVAAVLAAASYKGKNKELVLPAFVGMAAEQLGDIIDAESAKMISMKPNAGMAEKFLYDSMGLGCPLQGQLPQHDYPMMLASPTINAIDWDNEYYGEEAVYAEDNAGA